MFTSREEAFLYHEDAEHIPRGLRRYRKPDRMYGLGMTQSFEIYTRWRREITHSPFKDTGTPCLYPFLIIEAKSEKQTHGFDHIERQTELPLRTCLMLQRNLETSTGIPLQPLVWFVAFRGDEWRLYAATPNGPRTVFVPNVVLELC